MCLSRRELIDGAARHLLAAYASFFNFLELAAEERGHSSEAIDFGLTEFLKTQFEKNNVVHIAGKRFIIDDTLIIPPGKSLIGSDGTIIQLSDACKNTVDAVVKLAQRASLSNVILDGNLKKREALGTLSRYVYGAIISNVSSASVTDCVVVDCGSTKKFARDFGGNGGGFLIELTSGATSNVTNNRILRCMSIGFSTGFHARIESPFRKASGHTRFFACGNTISRLSGYYGNKNSIELVGPNTNGNLVENCNIINPLGQGGVEADFGASHNVFSRCSIVFERGMKLAKGFDAFSQRTFDLPGEQLFVPFGNKFVDCSITGSVSLNGHSIHGFSCFGAGHGAEFIRPVLDLSVERTKSVGTVIGIYVEDTFQPITGVIVINQSLKGADIPKLWYRRRADSSASPWA